MQQPAHRPVRVLLVEDDPVHRMVAERNLSRLSGEIEVVDATSDLAGARKALAAASPPVDAVLLDLTLPDSSLEATLAQLPSLLESWPARYVVTSALDSADVREAALRAGAAAFLSKQDCHSDQLRRTLVLPIRQPAVEDRPQQGSARRAVAAERSHRNGSALEATDGDPRTVTLDLRSLASKLAHDANSWITSGSFRVATIRGSVDRASADAIGPHLDAIEQSYAALTEEIRATRALVIEEITPLEPFHGRPLGSVAAIADDWRRAAKVENIVIDVVGDSETVEYTDIAFEWVVGILLSNVAHHQCPRRQGEPVTVRFQGTGGTTIEVSDDGPEWTVGRPAALGQPVSPGARGTIRPGMGLFRARRLMHRIGGRLDVVARKDVPGSYAVRLGFKGVLGHGDSTAQSTEFSAARRNEG